MKGKKRKSADASMKATRKKEENCLQPGEVNNERNDVMNGQNQQPQLNITTNQDEKTMTDRSCRGLKRKACDEEIVIGTDCSSQSTVQKEDLIHKDKVEESQETDKIITDIIEEKQETDKIITNINEENQETDKIITNIIEKHASDIVNELSTANVSTTQSNGHNVNLNLACEITPNINHLSSNIYDTKQSESLKNKNLPNVTFKEGNDSRSVDSDSDSKGDMLITNHANQSSSQDERNTNIVLNEHKIPANPEKNSLENVELKSLAIGHADEHLDETHSLKVQNLKENHADNVLQRENDRNYSNISMGTFPLDNSAKMNETELLNNEFNLAQTIKEVEETENDTAKSGPEVNRDIESNLTEILNSENAYETTFISSGIDNCIEEIVDNPTTSVNGPISQAEKLQIQSKLIENDNMKNEPKDNHDIESNKGPLNSENAIICTDTENLIEQIVDNKSAIVNEAIGQADQVLSEVETNQCNSVTSLDEIYLQSTDPVNVEHADDSTMDKNENIHVDLGHVEHLSEVDSEAISSDNASLRQKANRGHDMMSPRHAAEAPEMIADIADDLTDSQLCAMDWSSQVPQDIGSCPQSTVGPLPTKLKPEVAQVTSAQTRPEDGTAIMRGLIHEISQLNQMILRTKREIENVRHQRHQNYSSTRN